MHTMTSIVDVDQWRSTTGSIAYDTLCFTVYDMLYDMVCDMLCNTVYDTLCMTRCTTYCTAHCTSRCITCCTTWCMTSCTTWCAICCATQCMTSCTAWCVLWSDDAAAAKLTRFHLVALFRGDCRVSNVGLFLQASFVCGSDVWLTGVTTACQDYDFDATGQAESGRPIQGGIAGFRMLVSSSKHRLSVAAMCG